MWDIFNQDAFKVTTLAEVMREIKYIPTFVSSMGLFTTDSIDTLDFAIEKAADGTLNIVPSSPRGGPGQTVGKSRRSMRKLGVPHFQRDDAIYADEIMAKRALGQERATESFQAYIAQRAAVHARDFALTEEYHRLNLIINGKMLDSDGSVLVDYTAEFGESIPAEVDWDLDNPTPAEGILRKKATALTRAMGTSLDGLPFSGIVGLCGDAFYDDLLAHPEVRETYKGYAEAAALRRAYVPTDSSSNQAGAWSRADLFDIAWINYRGISGVTIDTNKCHFVPLSVPGLFKTVYAPADYMETVNTMGQPMYAKLWRMPNDKGMNLEYQTNVIHYLNRPRVLMKGRRT